MNFLIDPYDEEIRYNDLYMIYIVVCIFIRFNPDNKDRLIKTIQERRE